MKRPFFLFPLLVLLLLLGITASVGGGLLIINHDGSLFGMVDGWLQHSPFPN